jgi:predicted transposase/invertase (TIGR01784 family)
VDHPAHPLATHQRLSSRNATKSFTPLTGTRSAHRRGAVKRLDPTLDVVFKLLLTRERRLLADMLEGVLARPVGMPKIIDPTILGDRVGDKSVIYDIHAVLGDGSRADVEMQRSVPSDLLHRLSYYGTRDYSTQLRRGDGYGLLTPTHVIVWLKESVLPNLDRLHSIFEIRERHTNDPFGTISGHLSFHMLQLPRLSPSRAMGYAGKVERWARFFSADSDAELCQLASEDPIMALAKQTLDLLSEDPEAQDLARRRADAVMFSEMSVNYTAVEKVARMLLKQLRLRFGPVPDQVHHRVMGARPQELEFWAERVLTAPTLDEVLIDAPFTAGPGPHWLAPGPSLEPNEWQKRELLALRTRAQAELLLVQLRSCFGPMSHATHVRVMTASSCEIEEWTKQILTARTLDEALVPVSFLAFRDPPPEPIEDDSGVSENEMKRLQIAVQMLGRSEFLLRQLYRRFGGYSRDLRLHLESASPAEIRTWAERILVAQTVNELFAS